MNTIRNIEAATLLSIGTFCAAAVLSIVFHSAHALTMHEGNSVAAAPILLAPVVISAKRLTPAQKVAMANTDAAA